jgi:maltooligosyltrehalose trehalohydrolase
VRSKLSWGERSEPEHERLLAWYRSLIRLRAVEPSLTSSERPEAQIDPTSPSVVAIQRGPLCVRLNFGAARVSLPIASGARLLLGSPGSEVAGDVLHLPAWGVGVLRPPGRVPPAVSTWAPAQSPAGSPGQT